MCEKKGVRSLNGNPYGGKLSMGKDGENVCVFEYACVFAYCSFRAILSVY